MMARTCPKCGSDETIRSNHSHLCISCNYIWRIEHGEGNESRTRTREADYPLCLGNACIYFGPYYADQSEAVASRSDEAVVEDSDGGTS